MNSGAAPDTGLSYPAPGMTREGSAPAGYRVARHRVAVGAGRQDYLRLAEGIMSWRLHRLSGLRVGTGTPRAAEGVPVVLGFGAGPLRIPAPCRVVWTEQGGSRTGFGYGTLPGHPESGEESFTAVLAPDGTVYFELLAYSRHATWFIRLGGPVASACQRLVTRRYLAAAAALAAGTSV